MTVYRTHTPPAIASSSSSKGHKPTGSMSTTATLKSPSQPHPHAHSHGHSHSKSHSHSHSHSHSRSSRPSTTPRAQPAAASVGQPMPPVLSPKMKSPPVSINPKSPSPSYFGFVVGGDDSIPPDSNPGAHTRQNWNYPSSTSQNSIPTPRHVPVESNPEFEAFRRQSEQHHRFSLNNSVGSLSRPSQSRSNSNTTKGSRGDTDTSNSPASKQAPTPLREMSQSKTDAVSFFDIPRQESPVPLPLNLQNTVADHKHARLSLPTNGLSTPPYNLLRTQQPRSDTLPSVDKDGPQLVSPVEIAELLRTSARDTLILDLRVYQQYAMSRIVGAVNLCIPTTLLKRPAYNVERLAGTLQSEADREAFERWDDCSHIVVYDANSNLPKEAITCFNVLKKFTSVGWTGTGLVVKGGFLAFSKVVPEMVDCCPVTSTNRAASASPLSISASNQETLPVAGGCAMPSEQSAANPFFGNIRQNMDLLDGVGQIPVKKPTIMSESAKESVPDWLRKAADNDDEGKVVSDRFLKIEKSEQLRMQEAFNQKVSYGTPQTERPLKVQIAGVEKGSKNRYNNIFPFDHTRVKLQNVPMGGCDYINANHIQAEFSNRKYIATQAPIPATFNDFWRIVWEQDVRVIVMLTAASEGGQIKSHTYWNPGDYGPLKLKQLQERKVSLHSKTMINKTQVPATRPSLGERRSTTASLTGAKHEADLNSPSSTSPSATVRTFALNHSAYPFAPMRQITQIQYADWPDFGAPASPAELVSLVEQVNKYVRGSASPDSMTGPNEASPQGVRPVIVHCSAGCGRTGTFCTIDSVIDMLKRQRLERSHGEDAMDVDSTNDWVSRDDVDLVAKTVDDFRHQRLSMVQNLRQFVLCYESILEWLASQDRDSGSNLKRSSLGEPRRSYHG